MFSMACHPQLLKFLLLFFLKAISDSTKRCHNEQQQENKRILRLCFVCLKPIDYEMWNASGFWKGNWMQNEDTINCHFLIGYTLLFSKSFLQVPGLGQQLYTCSVQTGKCIFFPHWPGYERWAWEPGAKGGPGLPSHPTVFSAAKGALKTSTECPGWDSSSIFSSHKASFVDSFFGYFRDNKEPID